MIMDEKFWDDMHSGSGQRQVMARLLPAEHDFARELSQTALDQCDRKQQTASVVFRTTCCAHQRHDARRRA